MLEDLRMEHIVNGNDCERHRQNHAAAKVNRENMERAQKEKQNEKEKERMAVTSRGWNTNAAPMSAEMMSRTSTSGFSIARTTQVSAMS